MDKSSPIGFLGCGWLTLPLASRLAASGYTVKASTTTKSKLETLRQSGIDPYLVHFHDPDPSQAHAFLDSKALIISIPPGRNKENGLSAYRNLTHWLKGVLPDSSSDAVILISSTSVYADSNELATEETERCPTSPSASLIAEAEDVVLSLAQRPVVLRMAGLIGPERMPGRFFSGKENVPNGLAPVNLVHREDAIKFIERVLFDEKTNGIYNVCAPSHPIREEFYTLAASCESLPLPSFLKEKSTWKEIASNRLPSNFRYQISSLMGWLHETSRQ